jgi:hypothetical protein
LRVFSFIGLPRCCSNGKVSLTRFFSENFFLVFVVSRSWEWGSGSLTSDSFDFRSWDLDMSREPFIDGRPCSIEYRE